MEKNGKTIKIEIINKQYFYYISFGKKLYAQLVQFNLYG